MRRALITFALVGLFSNASLAEAAPLAKARPIGVRLSVLKEKVIARMGLFGKPRKASAESPAPANYGKVSIRRATVEDIPALAENLTRAFKNDPFQKWFTNPRSTTFRRRMAMKQYLREFLARGELYTTADLAAVAGWFPANAHERSRLSRIIFPLHDRMITGLKRHASRMATLDKIDEAHPKDPHNYLMLLGTDPAQQGKGAGSALMRFLADHSDRTQMPTVLTTENKENVPYYQKLGYEVVNKAENLPAQAPTVWFMKRESN